MSKSQINLQDAFLNQLRKENIPVTLYLTSGVQLRGQVRGFDAFTVILEGQGKPPQLVYKHSIVSVAPCGRHPRSWGCPITRKTVAQRVRRRPRRFPRRQQLHEIHQDARPWQ
jgi:host factor-I protein